MWARARHSLCFSILPVKCLLLSVPLFSNGGGQVKFYVNSDQDDMRQVPLIEEQQFMVLNAGCPSQASTELFKVDVEGPHRLL